MTEKTELAQLTDERAAAHRDQAVRELVRATHRLAQEVRYLQAILFGQDPIRPCKGCLKWNSLSHFTAYCEDVSTPERWYLAAGDGGEPGCPHYATGKVCQPMHTAIEVELHKFNYAISHIDDARFRREINVVTANRLKNRLVIAYGAAITRLFSEKK